MRVFKIRCSATGPEMLNRNCKEIGWIILKWAIVRLAWRTQSWMYFRFSGVVCFEALIGVDSNAASVVALATSSRLSAREKYAHTNCTETNKINNNKYVFPTIPLFVRKFRRRLFECSLFLLNITSSKNKQAKPTILLLMPGNKINFRMTKENAFNYVWASENQPARCWRWD